jgi:hypothetical protein
MFDHLQAPLLWGHSIWLNIPSRVFLDEPDLVRLYQTKPRFSSTDQMIQPNLRTPCVSTSHCRNL